MDHNAEEESKRMYATKLCVDIGSLKKNTNSEGKHYDNRAYLADYDDLVSEIHNEYPEAVKSFVDYAEMAEFIKKAMLDSV